MDNMLIYKYLLSKLHSEKETTIRVAGTSMHPTLHEGDCITICTGTPYSIGDILAFMYKGELLIHRLVKFENNRFFCKGDNSFRLEDLDIKNIIGKAVLINGTALPAFSKNNVELSYFVNREFRKCGYDIEKTKKSGVYRFYHQSVWNIEDKTLRYRLKKEVSSIAVCELLHNENIGVIQRSKEDVLFEKMNEFCDFNILLNCFSELYGMQSGELYNQMLSFLTKCILNKYIDVM